MLYKVAKVAREKQGRKVERCKDEGGTRSKKRSSSEHVEEHVEDHVEEHVEEHVKLRAG